MLESGRATSPRARGWTVSAASCRAALAAVIALLIVGAYYPFSWDPPHTVHNQVTRITGGALRFGTVNNARAPGTPAWLPPARRTGTVTIQLVADPRSARAHAPMMMLASDFWHADFAIAQEHSDLYVWLHRPGSAINGAPPFVVPGVLRPGQWASVQVLLRSRSITITVAGRTRLTRPLPAGAVHGWAPGQLALGGEVQGGFSWPGQIRTAVVRTPGYAVNYLAPGALSIPGSYLSVPPHIEPFPPTDVQQWLQAFVDLLTFLPVGFLICWSRRPPLHPVPATVLAAAFAVLLSAGKFLFAARHTSVADVAGQVIGALIGAMVAWKLAHTERVTRLWPAGQPGPEAEENQGLTR